MGVISYSEDPDEIWMIASSMYRRLLHHGNAIARRISLQIGISEDKVLHYLGSAEANCGVIVDRHDKIERRELFLLLNALTEDFICTYEEKDLQWKDGLSVQTQICLLFHVSQLHELNRSMRDYIDDLGA